MSKVLMYSTQVCPYCMQAERLLKLRGVEQIEKVLIDRDPARREEMMTRTGAAQCRRSTSATPTSAVTTICRSSIAKAACCRFCKRPD